jgi:pimeloyl-ACP methyl ester carboxylesterase
VTDLFYETLPGAPPPVVLLHEGAGSSAAWDRSKEDLAAGRQAVVYDRRGYGRSPRDVALDRRHFDQATEDLALLLRELGTAPVDLVGHSDGGSIALLLAARHPELVRSVVAVATHVLADPVTRAAVNGLGAPGSWDERARSRYGAAHGADWEEVVASWLHLWTQGWLSDWDMQEELSHIRAPVLVVHDRRDPLSPVVHAERLEQLVPDCCVRWYDTGSHRPHLAEHDRFTSDVHAFWDETRASEESDA